MMEDSEKIFEDPSPSGQKTPCYSQVGSIAEPSLSGLRDQIKKIMIPMLIKIFQLKVDLSQSVSVPSRLQNSKKTQSTEEILDHLKRLDEDLNLLILWCQSCRNQVGKALSAPEEEHKQRLSATACESAQHSAVAKSFSEALSASSIRMPKPPISPPVIEPPKPVSSLKKSWWQRLFFSSKNNS